MGAENKEVKWWARLDSNLRSSASESSEFSEFSEYSE